MKLWGRKRHLHTDGESRENVAAGNAPALQRDGVSNAVGDKMPSGHSLLQADPDWKMASPMPLVLDGMSTTVDMHWDRALASWKDPTTTSTPLSHYKTASAPSGEVESIAIIKEHLAPPQGEALSLSEPGANVALDVASRRRSQTKTFFGSAPSAPLQRISFSSPRTAPKNTAAAKSPFIGRQVTEPYPLHDVAQAPYKGLPTQDGSETKKMQTPPVAQAPYKGLPTQDGSEIKKMQTPPVAQALESGMTSAMQPIPKLQLARPGRQLVKAPREDKIFRSLGVVQRLSATAGNLPTKTPISSRKTDSGITLPSSAPNTRTPMAVGPDQPQSGQFPPAAEDLKNITQGDHKPADIFPISPLIGDKQEIKPIGSIALPKASEQPVMSTHEDSGKPHVQRESVTEKPLPISRKIGTPIKQTPDSAISFSNLGSPNYTAKTPLPVREQATMPVAKKIDHVKPSIELPAPVRQIPKLGPIPIQRLNMAKKQGSDFTKSIETPSQPGKVSEGSGKVSEGPLPPPKTLTQKEERKSIAAGDDFVSAAIPLSNPAISPLLGSRGIPLNISNADLPREDMTETSANVAHKSLQAEPFALQRMSANPPSTSDAQSFTQLPMSSDNPLFKTLSKDFTPERPLSNAYSSDSGNHFVTASAGGNRQFSKPAGESSQFPKPAGESSQFPKPLGEMPKKLFRNAGFNLPTRVSPLKWGGPLSTGNLQVQRTQMISSGTDAQGGSFAQHQAMSPVTGLGLQSGYNLSDGQRPGFFSAHPGQMMDAQQHQAGNLLLQRKPLEKTDLKPSSKFPARSYYLSSAQKSSGKEPSHVIDSTQSLQRFKMPNITKQLGSVSKLLGNQFFGSSQPDVQNGNNVDNSDKGTPPTQTKSGNPISDLSQDDLRRLAARVYPHISQKIKAEIERDRERAGMITGLHR